MTVAIGSDSQRRQSQPGSDQLRQHDQQPTSVLLNADDLSARSGSPDPNLVPSYSTSHEIDISYASSGNQVCQISEPHVTGQTPATTSTWQVSYSGGGCASPPSSCPTSNRANATARSGRRTAGPPPAAP